MRKLNELRQLNELRGLIRELLGPVVGDTGSLLQSINLPALRGVSDSAWGELHRRLTAEFKKMILSYTGKYTSDNIVTRFAGDEFKDQIRRHIERSGTYASSGAVNQAIKARDIAARMFVTEIDEAIKDILKGYTPPSQPMSSVSASAKAEHDAAPAAAESKTTAAIVAFDQTIDSAIGAALKEFSANTGSGEIKI